MTLGSGVGLGAKDVAALGDPTPPPALEQAAKAMARTGINRRVALRRARSDMGAGRTMVRLGSAVGLRSATKPDRNEESTVRGLDGARIFCE
jgi:hypothetical protein